MIRILFFAFVIASFDGLSQHRYFTEKAHISFFSSGVVEDITASNTKVTSLLNLANGEIEGKIVGFDASNTLLQHVKAVGRLTIHGVTQEIDIPGTLHIQGETVALQSKFIVKLMDYNIKVPQIVWQNIAQQVEVTVDFLYNTHPVIN